MSIKVCRGCQYHNYCSSVTITAYAHPSPSSDAYNAIHTLSAVPVDDGPSNVSTTAPIHRLWAIWYVTSRRPFILSRWPKHVSHWPKHVSHTNKGPTFLAAHCQLYDRPILQHILLG